MDRRGFLSLAAAGTASILGACTERGVSPSESDSLAPPPSPAQSSPPVATTVPATVALTSAPTATTLPSGPQLAKVPLPSGGLVHLPGEGSLLAWTVDDGADGDVIRRYVEFAAASGTRFTFLVTATYRGWKDGAVVLQPLVASGQIQLANHTRHHDDLTTVSDGRVISELQGCHDFLFDTFGVDARPFYRPPYGARNPRTDRLAASIGYSTPVMWRGTLSHKGATTRKEVVGLATQWFLPQHIVIGHFKTHSITEVFPQLEEIIRARALQTVTLNDVFLR